MEKTTKSSAEDDGKPSKQAETRPFPPCFLLLGTFNARSCGSGNLPNVVEYCRQSKCDIIAVQETKKPKDQIVQTYGDFNIHWVTSYLTNNTDGKNQKNGGLAFFVRHYLGPVKAYELADPRIACCKFMLNGVNICYINIYAPASSTSIEEARNFYTLLSEQYEIMKRDFHGPIIIGGDFNAVLYVALDGSLAPHIMPNVYDCDDYSNNHGSVLHSFLVGSNLYHINSRYHDQNKWTMEQVKGSKCAELDGFLSERLDLIHNLAVWNEDAPSDHRMVLSVWRISRKFEEKHLKYQEESKSNNSADGSLNNLINAVKAIPSYQSFVEILKNVNDTELVGAAEILNVKNSNNVKDLDVVSQSIPNNVDVKANNVLAEPSDNVTKELFEILTNEVKEEIKNNGNHNLSSLDTVDVEVNNVLLKLLEKLDNKESTEALKSEVSEIIEMTSVLRVTNEYDVETKDLKEEIKVCVKSFESLKIEEPPSVSTSEDHQELDSVHLPSDRNQGDTSFSETLEIQSEIEIRNVFNRPEPNEVEVEQLKERNVTVKSNKISNSEVQFEIQNLNIHSLSGHDKVEAKDLKKRGNVIVESLTKWFNEILDDKETVPKEWIELESKLPLQTEHTPTFNKEVICPSLLACLYASILARRLAKSLKKYTSSTQWHFRDSPEDMAALEQKKKESVSILTYLNERQNESGLVYFAFVKYSDPCNSVQKSSIAKALKIAGAPEYLQNAFNDLLSIDGIRDAGIHLGSVASPVLLSIVSQMISNKCENKYTENKSQLGIECNGSYVWRTQFEDTLVIIGADIGDIRIQLEDLAYYGRQHGLAIDVQRGIRLFKNEKTGTVRFHFQENNVSLHGKLEHRHIYFCGRWIDPKEDLSKQVYHNFHYRLNEWRKVQEKALCDQAVRGTVSKPAATLHKDQLNNIKQAYFTKFVQFSLLENCETWNTGKDMPSVVKFIKELLKNLKMENFPFDMEHYILMKKVEWIRKLSARNLKTCLNVMSEVFHSTTYRSKRLLAHFEDFEGSLRNNRRYGENEKALFEMAVNDKKKWQRFMDFCQEQDHSKSIQRVFLVTGPTDADSTIQRDVAKLY